MIHTRSSLSKDLEDLQAIQVILRLNPELLAYDGWLNDGDGQCLADHESGYVCSRQIGHKGPHVALHLYERDYDHDIDKPYATPCQIEPWYDTEGLEGLKVK